jgi:hypothetical protein
LPVEFAVDESVTGSAEARDILDIVQARNGTLDREILFLASLGAGVREIARDLHVSHTTVVKHLQVIRLTVLSLGIRVVSEHASRPS